MTEILIGAAVGLSFAGLAFVAEKNRMNTQREMEARRAALLEPEKKPDGGRVLEILRRVYRDMTAQKMAGCGAWVPDAIRHSCADPAVALMAVRWTIRDLLGRADYLDVPGLKFRYSLEVLEDAEAELEGLAA